MPRTFYFLIVVLALSGCAQALPSDEDGETDGVRASLASPLIERWGTDTTLDIATWNIEWFGHRGRGPTNESLQLDRVAGVMAGADIELWALQEIVNADHFEELVDELPGYAGLLANDPRVVGNRSYHRGEQKPAFVWRRDAMELVSARLILRDEDFAFAGRPPLEVHMRVNQGTRTVDVWFITFHAKAGGGIRNWERRKQAGDALSDYVRTERNRRSLVQLGDYNDDLDESIVRSRPSPYTSLVSQRALVNVTMPLSQRNEGTTLRGRFPLDHVILRNTRALPYVDDSVELLRLDEQIRNYGDTTSDHFPVAFRMAAAQTTPTSGGLVLNEVLANEPGRDTAQEFVEIVNTSNRALALDGFTISDAVGVRHVFGQGTRLSPGSALLVSGGANYGRGTIVASSGRLGLNNSGDRVTVSDARGNVLSEASWSRSTDGVSINRQVDGAANAPWVRHTEFGTERSPLRRTNGRRF